MFLFWRGKTLRDNHKKPLSRATTLTKIKIMRQRHKYYIYIMTNKSRKVLYVGVTGDLENRIWQHKTHRFKKSFTDKYNCEYCIYYEEFTYINDAIDRETQLKKWTRKKKETLINAINPEWREIVNERGYIR